MSRWSFVMAGVGFLFGQAQVQASDVAPSPAAEAGVDAEKITFFEKKIRPLLAGHCYTCHSAFTNAKGGLRVDERRGILAGGNRGRGVVPHEPDASLLLKAVRQQKGAPAMPPDGRLDDSQIADLEKWITDGAVWPVETPALAEIREDQSHYQSLLEDHWAWQPLSRPTVPEVKGINWAKTPVDRFILAKLEAKGLTPAAQAEKEALIRRATYDLTGLPPTPGEIDRFLADQSPEAFANLVDRLLDTPAFGEHWGRHWLDVARYGESTGSSRNLPYPHAWRYRDYVIDSFQRDKPYDVFIQEQIAGDLLPFGTQAQRDEQVTATGFLALGVKDVNQRFKNRFILDNIDEQIDTVSQAILGLTVSCARCHDHKFDPIPTTDYYALVGIFQSTDLCAGVRNKMGGGGLDYYDTSMLLPLGSRVTDGSQPEAHIEEVKARLEEAQAEFRRLQQDPAGAEKGPNGRPKRQIARQKVNRIQQELAALTDPAVRGPVAYGVRDAQLISDAEIRLRGEPEQYGPLVPRGFLSLVKLDGVPSVPANQSGRLELAQWLTHPHNPLAIRVIVNRIWSHLFGNGLVTTVDNFGINGDHPSHPELLDALALRFVEQNWSFKAMIRELMLTNAYQMGTASNEQAMAIDPRNRWLWRQTPRRLTAEEIRDTMLQASHQLERERPTASPAAQLKVIELRNNGAEARNIEVQARDSRRRSLYLPLVRGLVPTSLHVFDFAEQGMVTGHRDETTVAPQALYLLNDPFVREQSQELAVAIVREHSTSPARVHAVYRTLLGRLPEDHEAARVAQYIAETVEMLENSAQDQTQGSQVASVQESASIAQSGTTKGAASNNANGGTAAEIIDPDQIIEPDAPVAEKVLADVDPETKAWASVIQAIYGSAEFRYLK